MVKNLRSVYRKNEFIFLQTLLFYNFYDKDLLKPNDKKGVDNTGKDLTPFSVRWEDAAEAIKLALEIDLKRLHQGQKNTLFL